MMICTKEVQEKCPFSIMCGGPCKVADDSECADFITKVITGQDVAPVEASPEEAAYLQQERKAIQAEGARLIDVKALGIGLCEPEIMQDQYAAGWNNAVKLVLNAPAVDAVEVVRCKDCISAEPMDEHGQEYCVDGCMICAAGRGAFMFGRSVVCPDDYCNDGVRKEDAHAAD